MKLQTKRAATKTKRAATKTKQATKKTKLLAKIEDPESDIRLTRPSKTYSQKPSVLKRLFGQIHRQEIRKMRLKDHLRRVHEVIYDYEEDLIWNTTVYGNILTGLDMTRFFDRSSRSMALRSQAARKMSKDSSSSNSEVYAWERVVSGSSVWALPQTGDTTHATKSAIENHPDSSEKENVPNPEVDFADASVPIGQPRFHKRDKRGKWKILPQRQAYAFHKVSSKCIKNCYQ